MRITLVSTWTIVNAGGGAEKMFSLLANALAERGHHVTCICFDFIDGKPGFPLDERVSFVNAGVGRTPPWWLSKQAINLISAVSLSRERRREKRLWLRHQFVGGPLIKAVRRSKPDVVIAIRPEDAYAVNCFGKMNVPVVTMSHNATAYFLPDYSAESLKKAVEKSAAVQVLMPDFADEVRVLLPKANVVVIPNPVPQFEETADRTSHEIINVARISWQKHQDLLVESFALLADKYPDWIVKIWGGNNDEPQNISELQELIDKIGLSDRILLCGTTNDVRKELSLASIFAFPSRWEGFSLALTEAMAMGLPAVGVSDCPSVNRLIENNKNGLLSDSTPASYAAALEELMKSEELRVRLGDEARRNMESYSATRVWDRWEALLQSVVCDAK